MSGGTERREAVGLRYQPALDGVRAVAVAMVLCFHAGFGWMRGGYFGVSIFFTLSGFLITSLLLSERERTGRIALGSFVARRAKRLLPASVLCLALVSIARLMGQFEQVPGLRTELLGAAAHAFNWIKVGGDSSYTDVFAQSAQLVSPLEHYWSLAIEEQFYLVWPMVIVLLARRVTRWSVVLPALFLVAAVTTPIAALMLTADATYWATPMRAGELLAGAALASVVRRWGVPVWAGRLGLPLAAIIVALAVVLPTAGGPAYAGFLAPIAVLSAALLWSVQAPGALRSALESRPLVTIGRISYGLYLFHWPLFVWLRQQGWSLTEPWRFAVALAATGLISFLSFRLVEQPLRSATWPTARTLGAATVAMAVTIATIAVLPFSRGFLEADAELLSAASAAPVDSLAPLERRTVVTLPTTTDAVSSGGSETARSSSAARSAARPDRQPVTAVATDLDAPVAGAAPFPIDVELGDPLSRPVRVLVVGDSTAFYVGQAFAEWALEHREHATTDLLWCEGCGFLRAGTVKSWDNERLDGRNSEMLDVDLPAMVARVQPDIAVLMVTVVDVADRQWGSAEGPIDPTDERYAARLAAAYRRIALDLVDQGVGNVLLVKPPRAIGFVANDRTFQAERWHALHAALDEAAAQSGPAVRTLDLAKWAKRTGFTTDENWRPDGTHLTSGSARDVVTRWLAPSVIAAAQ